jgi:uncharacterized protein YjdB
MKNRKALFALATALAIGLGTVAIIGGHDNLSINAAGTETYSCGSITFGANISTGIGTSLTASSLSAFTTSSNITVSSLSITKSYYKSNYSTTAASYAARIAASGSSGSLGFNFGTALTIKSARVYAAAWDSSPSLVVATANTTASGQTIAESTAPSITDEATGTGKYYEYTLDSSATTSSLTLSCSSRVYILKIVLCLSGAGSTTSSAASSSASSSSSETPSSSSSSSAGTYRLVNKSSDIAVGGSYLIASAKAAGTAYFMGNSTASSYYRSRIGGTIADDLRITPASTMEEFTLGGSSSAYTLTSTKMSSGNGTLASNTSYTTDLIIASSANTWTLSFDSSTSAVTIQNVDTNSYIEAATSYFDCSDTSASVYLFVKQSDPSLALSSTTLSLAAGSTDTTISVTASNFSSTPTYTVSSNNENVATGSVSGTTLSVSGLTSGSATFTITASSGSESASATLSVFVTSASGAYLTIDNSSLTLYKGRANGSVQATGYNFSGTVTYSASSSSSAIASVSINSSTGLASVSPVAVGSAEITFTASNGSESSSAICNVTVETAPTATLTLSPTSLSLYASGSAGQITATASGFTSPTYSAVSSNTSAATVSMTGTLALVTPVAEGSATITITAQDSYSSKTATCAVTVAAAATGTTTDYSNMYRIAPQYAGSSATSATYYTVTYSNGMYRVTATHTITKNAEYTTYDDVAAYYQAFKGYPSNYSTSISYTGNERLISNYSRTANTGYWANINTTRNAAAYVELDIAVAGSTSYKSSSTRGVLRVVVCPGGFNDYGTDPVCLYTGNHYSSFIEYQNHYGGWGDAFNGEGTTYSARTKLTTVTYALS